MKKLTDIPGFQKLLVQKLKIELQSNDVESAIQNVKDALQSGDLGFGCRVLKRTIRSVEDGSVTVTYCSDEKLIKKFLKRRKSKKATAAHKPR